MSLTSREIIYGTLRFESPPRIGRDLWVLPWARQNHPQAVRDILADYPQDITVPQRPYRKSEHAHGDPYTEGEYTDEWDCKFKNVQAGIEGEMREPLIENLSDISNIKPPYEILPDDVESSVESINSFCRQTDKFTLAPTSARPWERYQFIRGTENALMDIAASDDNMRALLNKIHDFYIEEMKYWAKTKVDALFFADDWGQQKQMLVSPKTWRDIFKPLYSQYVRIAHDSGKFIFYRSNGYIIEILPDLIEMGVDAINCQLGCMPLDKVAEVGKGRVTFWGEIDRQNVLPASDPEIARQEVKRIAENLYDPSGGIIAQCQFGPAANPACIRAVFEEWERLHSEL